MGTPKCSIVIRSEVVLGTVPKFCEPLTPGAQRKERSCTQLPGRGSWKLCCGQSQEAHVASRPHVRLALLLSQNKADYESLLQWGTVLITVK